MLSYVYLALAFLLNSLGTILVKVHARHGFQTTGSLVSLVTGNIYFLLALGAFALNLVAYSFALARLPLSVAYPVMTVASFLIVNAFSYLYFGESINSLQVAGYVCILFGIFCVIRFAHV